MKQAAALGPTDETPLAEHKRFDELRKRAAEAGHRLTYSGGRKGAPAYVASCWGMSRHFDRIDQLSIFVDLVTGAIDARVAGRPQA